MALDIGKLRVVEWSPSQKCFHVESIEEMIRCNQRVFRGETITDYLPIAIFDNYEDVENFLAKGYSILKRKEK